MDYKKLILLVIINISICESLYSTEQYPDKLIYKNKIYEINYNYPLEIYYQIHPESFPPIKISTTALNRGFVGTFEVKGNEVYLKNIEVYISTKNLESESGSKWRSIFKEVFPNKSQIKIDWFSGILVMEPESNLSNPKQDLNENKTILEVIDGQITFLKEFSNKNFLRFSKKEFLAYKKTKIYRQQMRSMKGEGLFNRRIFKNTIQKHIFYYIDKLKYQTTSHNKVPPYIGEGIVFGDIDYIYRAGDFGNLLNSVGNPLRRWHGSVLRNS